MSVVYIVKRLLLIKMKVCVLVSDYEETNSVLKNVDAPRNPTVYDESESYKFTIVPIKKTTAVKQVADLAKSKLFDVYLNLCEACWYDDTAGFEVVDALHKLNMPYTGSNPTFYQATKSGMKIGANSCGVLIPNHVFAYDQFDIDTALKQNFQFPVIVKHHNGHDSVGMTENSRVDDEEQLVDEARKIIDSYGGALIEEFIEGPEYTVLVLENPDDPENPIALTPAQCKFPEGETFKHFDLKWTKFHSLSWEPVTDPDIAERLKDASRKVFLGCCANSYARCDFRLRTSTDELFFLEINANCSILYEKGSWGSADYILSFDPLGHQGFMKTIFRTALLDQDKRRGVIRPFYTPQRGFHVRATEDIPVGGLIQRNEERPTFLVSRKQSDQRWGPLKKKWLSSYAYPFSQNVFGIWDSDPNEWQPVNHSCDPNAWLDGLNVVAREKIRKGEEITLDYATFQTAEFVDQFQCNCGSKNCRKLVKPASDYKEKWFYELYKNHSSDFVEQYWQNNNY